MEDVTTIGVSVDELAEVVTRVEPFCDDHEGWPLGHVLLTSRGRRRLWVAGDGEVVATLLGDGPAPPAPVLLPPRLLPHPGMLDVLGVDEAELQVPPLRADGSRTGPLRLVLGEVSIAQPAGVGHYPPLEAAVEELSPTSRVRCQLSGLPLLTAVQQIRTKPGGLELGPDYPPPPAWLIAEPGRVGLRVDWPGIGRAETWVAAEVAGSARIMVHLIYLEQLLHATDGERLVLDLPLSRGGMITVRDGVWEAALARDPAFPTPDELFERVRQCLADDFGLGDVHADRDGDLPMPFEDQQLLVRVAEGEPPVVQVFTVLDAGSADEGLLLQMLNDLNADIRFARVFVVDGQVLVETDVAYDHDVADLRDAALRIADLARMLRPVMALRQQTLPGF